VDCKLRLW
jgi:hypothetical protein